MTTMRELLDNPVYAAYFNTPPDTTYRDGPHPSLVTGYPWQVWARTVEGRWLTKLYAAYPLDVALRYLDKPTIADVTIVSRRVFYAPPGKWKRYKRTNPKTKAVEVVERWETTFFPEYPEQWCGRCRRPVQFRHLFNDHHALRGKPCLSIEDNPLRCEICGIREVAMGDPDLMMIVEA